MVTEFMMGNMRKTLESLRLRKGDSFTEQGGLLGALVMFLEIFFFFFFVGAVGRVANRITSLGF